MTIRERKARESARRAAAAQGVMDSLRAFVRETGRRGRFIVFGSAASGAIRFSSDFDVLVDFRPDLRAGAWKAIAAARVIVARFLSELDVFKSIIDGD